MPQPQQQQVPNVITSRQPFTSIAFQRMPGGFVQPLIGYESNYPHVIDVSPRDYAAPFLAMAFNPMAYIPQGAPQQPVQQQPQQQARPAGRSGTGQRKTTGAGAGGQQAKAPPLAVSHTPATQQDIPPTAMTGREMFNAALAPYINQKAQPNYAAMAPAFPSGTEAAMVGADPNYVQPQQRVFPTFAHSNAAMAAALLNNAYTSARNWLGFGEPQAVPTSQVNSTPTDTATSAAQLKGLLQPTPTQQVTEAILDEALRAATPPLPAPVVPVQPVQPAPVITIPPIEPPAVTSGMATLRRMLGFQ